MTKAPTPTEMPKGQSYNTNNATKQYYGRHRLIRSVLGASKYSALKLIAIVILWVYFTSLLQGCNFVKFS